MAHLLQLYESPDFLVDKVVQFVDGGCRGAPALLIVMPEHAGPLRRRLEGRERTLVLDAADTLERFMVDGMPDERRFRDTVHAALAEVAVPGRNARAFGEMVAVLWARGQYDAALRLEELWNGLLDGRDVDLLCAYPLGAFGDPERRAAFLGVCAEHGRTLPTEAVPGEVGAEQASYIADLQQQALSLGAALTRATLLHEKLQEERRARLEQVEEQNRRKDEFLAMLAHELRNPLTPVHHALQIVRQRGDDPAALDKALDIMERQFSHMVRLVDDLLDVTRISRGIIDVRRERVELTALVQEAAESARLLAGDRTLTVRVPPEPVFLHGDPTRLNQVMDNLLSNALKFTRQDGHIGLTLEREGDRACLRVWDDGAGIPADRMGGIFDLFVQGGHLQGGLGVGLTLVKTLTELHGGTVEALSDGEGHGSEFVVRLPFTVEAEAPPEVTLAPSRGTSLRVLLVDDNQDSVESLSELLRSFGHEVDVASDGPEALEAARRMRPDVVLLDLGLPTWGGHEVARRIRREPWGHYVVLLAWTGWGQEAERERSREAGFDRHLVKPADYEVLVDVLERTARSLGAVPELAA